jgi:cytochrome c553
LGGRFGNGGNRYRCPRPHLQQLSWRRWRLAAYYAKKPWVPVPQKTTAAMLKKGKGVIFENCEDCHGATGSDPDIDAPKLNGQWAKYMELELEKYRDENFLMPHRKMKKTARKMKEGTVPAAAHFYGAQKR